MENTKWWKDMDIEYMPPNVDGLVEVSSGRWRNEKRINGVIKLTMPNRTRGKKIVEMSIRPGEWEYMYQLVSVIEDLVMSLEKCDE